jgi:hypothetical protein
MKPSRTLYHNQSTNGLVIARCGEMTLVDAGPKRIHQLQSFDLAMG